ncbi:cation diffusion facilitator family transporter [Orenia metallireducens]|jgi:cation diffusion facilitator family transporter|uniref:Cation diffusion facilitator family transporter n=1 Tax=Orenia metallireducens TaxID=1413210 RepID=A0A285H239_9FIRM|nr:cation diffusion facilitator family transporter [Orenia metallireducens]PRX29432.1 cation diffusion facilitator family transporter [Orenia metallireducens]SNY29795.1 cation diffusion facilitator family transporter [Orenia metallireducens]
MKAENRYNLSKRVSVVGLIVNIALAIAKIIVGFLFRSKALVADGFHSVSDIASTLVVMFSMKISELPPDKEHPYGHGKAESIGTKILGIILILTGFGLAKGALENIFSAEIAIPGKLVLWVAILSIISKELLYRYTIKVGRMIDSKAIMADAHHHRSDAFSSIAALIGAGGALLGYPVLDPLAGLVVALFIIKLGFEVLLDAIDELMDAVPSQDKMEEIKDQIESLDNIIDIGDIKLRSYGPRFFVDLEVVVADDLTVVEGHKVAVKVRDKIKELHPSVEEVLVHIDPESVYKGSNNSG